MKNILPALLVGLVFLGMPTDVLAQGEELSPWQVRLRGIAVVPEESATISAIGGDAHIKNDYVPELDITYFLSPNFALELILATTSHDVMAIDTALGNVPLGNVNLLPPTLTAQYHFNPGGKIRPYFGAGLNWTIFFDEDAAGGAVTTWRVENAIGFALQAGVDIALSNHWMLNLDVKRLFLDTKASINDGAINAKVKVDPWIFGVGFGYRF